MTKILLKLAEWWMAETPKIARFLQVLSGALATLPLYYNGLPDEFKTTITPDILHIIAVLGFITTFLLQFFKTKQS